MFVIGTAGHVDHGKSLLVETLTGIDPDRLREEKTRGMTIDLGFAWLTLPSGRSVSIVDVPGHERFIKNMLAGAGGIDVALLVIAADDGVMPQTREHLAILDLLDVQRGVVALTKTDLVDEDWLDMLEPEIGDVLASTTLAGSSIVRCSALRGQGLDALKTALDVAVDALPAKRDIGRPRLPIDRVFTIGGFGTVVTGTLIDGVLTTGMELEAMPGGLRGRVRGLQNHREKVERAEPGTRTAVNVNGLAKEDLRRGMVLGLAGASHPTDVLDARVRAVGSLRHNMRVTFHVYADEAEGQLRLLDADDVPAGDEVWAQIKLARPVAMSRRDRFVLRTANNTIAGGIAVDTQPKRHRRKHQGTIDALAALLSVAPEDVLFDAISRSPMIEVSALPAAVSTTLSDAMAALRSLVDAESVRIVGVPARAASSTWLDATHELATATLAEHHARYHLRAGMPQEELRHRLKLESRIFAELALLWGDVQLANGLASLRTFSPAPTA
ncbi:MAG TPA: selenocysteine-specific translation elongation factor, partial [Dehalococcoidia bacterium]